MQLVGPSGNNIEASTDHAYEKGWLEEFFNKAIFTEDSSNCAVLNQLLFQNCGNQLQTIYNGLAGVPEQAEFMGTSKYVNDFLKGLVSRNLYTISE